MFDAVTPLPHAGRRLVPSVIDDRAQRTPDRPFASIPNALDVGDGFRDISYSQLAEAINKCAWWIEREIGRSTSFDTLAYLGPNDLSYAIILVAAIKTGHKAFFPSPRNSVDGHLSLLGATDCRVFLRPSTVSPQLHAVLSRRPVKSIIIPTLQHWLDGGDVPHYPYGKTFAEARHDPFVVLHTSGSTGIPKPVTWTHGSVAVLDAYRLISSRGGQATIWTMMRGHRVLLGAPLFHAAGVALMLPNAVFVDYTVVLPPPVLPTAELIDRIHASGQVQQSVVVSSILVNIAASAAYTANIAHLKRVIFIGAPLPLNVGDILRRKAELCNGLSATEALLPPLPVDDPDDWAYLACASEAGCEFRPVSDELSELVIVRDKRLEAFQGTFHIFPHLQEYPMQDLYRRHPAKPGLWLYQGRLDDIIVFANGEKLNPLSMEQQIGCHPRLSGCLLVGQAQTEAATILEPRSPLLSTADEEALLDDIWPWVDHANKTTVAHGRISRDLILFTTPDKPMLRAGKGSVQRKLTIQSYQTEIDELYASLTPAAHARPTRHALLENRTSVHLALRRFITDSIDVETVDGDANLFDLGLDSLHTVRLVRDVNNRLGRPILHARDVYHHPSVNRLTTVILSALSRSINDVGSHDPSHDRIQNMRELFQKYAADLPITVRPPAAHVGRGRTVLLTGSTGSLGSYLLARLLDDASVRRIHCLNRSAHAEQLQHALHAQRGLTASWDPDRVQFHHYAMSQPYLGLPTTQYLEMLHSATHIIHNAWTVHFNRTTDSFTTHIYGVRQLIDFSARSAHGTHILFLSTIGAVMQWDRNGHTPVPEQILDDWSLPQASGYAESKFIAERLLNEAAQVAGIPSTVWRIGQIAGPTSDKGSWNQAEWLPSLITSSKYLGAIPNALGSMDMVDWIPVDVLARTIMEVFHATSGDRIVSQTTVPVYHARNSATTPWSTLLPSILQSAPSLRVVPFGEWIDLLHDSVPSTEEVKLNPAVKLLDFYQNIHAGNAAPSLATIKTSRLSATLSSLSAVNPTWMETWMQQWQTCAV